MPRTQETTSSNDEAIIVQNIVGGSTGPFPTLTDREREVAMLLAEGKKNAEIADELDISVKTVDTHRAHALRKLSVRNNVELCRLAIREGYLEA